jgi:hypothetical protein
MPRIPRTRKASEMDRIWADSSGFRDILVKTKFPNYLGNAAMLLPLIVWLKDFFEK